MKCPICGSWSKVTTTCSVASGPLRKRECGNWHRFDTVETVVEPVGDAPPVTTRPLPDTPVPGGLRYDV